MNSKKHNGKIFSLLIAVSGLCMVVTLVSLLQFGEKKPLSTKAAYSSAINFRGIQLYKGYFSKGNPQPVTLTGGIYTGTGAPDLATGNLVTVGVAMVGTGTLSVTDSRGNTYNLVKKQEIDPGSSISLFVSQLSTSLKAYDTVTVKASSAKSLAVSAIAFEGVGTVGAVNGVSGFNKNPVSPTVSVAENNVIIVAAGFRAKGGDFSASYDPQVKVVSGADSGTTGNSMDNSSLIMNGFITGSAGTYGVQIPISQVKSKTGIPWGSITAVFN